MRHGCLLARFLLAVMWAGPAFAAPSQIDACGVSRHVANSAGATTATNKPPTPSGQRRSASALELVNLRADQRIDRGFDLASRGAIYAARAEFIRALEMIGFARDGMPQSTGYHDAIVAGLTALDEVDDLLRPTTTLTTSLDLAGVVAAHKTPVCKDAPADRLTPVIAARQYCEYGQQALLHGCLGFPAASRALYGLGRVELAVAESANGSIGGPKVMVILETALRVDPNHHAAANELGVLLTTYGQHVKAKDVLLQSVRARPTAEAWYNLRAVCERLGEHQEAQVAVQQFDSILRQRAPLSQRLPPTLPQSDGLVSSNSCPSLHLTCFPPARKSRQGRRGPTDYRPRIRKWSRPESGQRRPPYRLDLVNCGKG